MIFKILLYPIKLFFAFLLNVVQHFKDVRLLTCTLVVCAIMFLAMPKTFHWNPLVTIAKTIELVKNYE